MKIDLTDKEIEMALTAIANHYNYIAAKPLIDKIIQQTEANQKENGTIQNLQEGSAERSV